MINESKLHGCTPESVSIVFDGVMAQMKSTNAMRLRTRIGVTRQAQPD